MTGWRRAIVFLRDDNGTEVVEYAVMVALVVVLRRRRQFVALVRNRRTRWILVLAAIVIALNWGGYIWGVNNGYVVETSLGYFINPLVTVLMGVLILKETLRPAQWVALGIAGTVLVMIPALTALVWGIIAALRRRQEEA